MTRAAASKRKPRRARGFVRPGGRFTLFPRRQVTAVDIDGEVLRVVQTVRRNGRTLVTRLAAEALTVPSEKGWSDPVVVGGCLAKALQRLKVKAGPVVMGVPRALVVLRTIEVPATVDRGELASMVHFQIAKDLPFPVEEAVIDFKLTRSRVPKLEEGSAAAEGVQPKASVLVAAVKREVVQFYRQIAETAHLKLTALGLRSYANARCLEACGITTEKDAIALVSLRPDEVIIDVLEEQSLVFSRVASVKQPTSLVVPPPEEPEVPPEAGLGDGPRRVEELSFPDAVMIEVVRSLHSYQGMVGHRPVTKVVVTGGTGNEPAVVQALQKRLSMDCDQFDPTSALGLPESEREHASGALAVFGLALGVNDAGSLPFDFLKPKRPPIPINKVRIRSMALAAAALFVVLGMVVIRSRLMGERLAEQRAVGAELGVLTKQRPLYRQVQMQAKLIQNWLGDETKWLDHYTYLSTVLPTSKEVYLSSISSSARGSIRFSVAARSGEILAQLDQRLRAAGYDVKPLAINPAPDKFGYTFRSNVEVGVPDKFKLDWVKGILPGDQESAGAEPAKTEPKRTGSRGKAAAGRPKAGQ